MFRIRCLVLSCLIASAWPLDSAPALTVIQDVLYKADGARFNGVAIIEWKGFETADARVVPTQLVTVQIRNGNLYVQLAPTTNVSNGAYYSVRYNSDGRIQFSEIWAVRPSVTPLKLRDVRISRETTGAAAALIQGGGPSFVDSEIPSGVVDGANVTFTLSQSPVPPSSLALYRNGILQKAGYDYTLNGNTITFAAASTPQTGDILLASYRLTDPNHPAGAAGGALTGAYPNPVLADGVVSNANVAPNAAIAETKLALHYPTHSNAADPQVVCGASGGTTTATNLVQLGSCLVPSSALADGARLEMRFEYSHEGLSQGFSVQVKWGDTIILSRSVPAGEGRLTGRVELGVSGGRASWSALSWGAVSPLSSGAGEALDSLAAPVLISLDGMINGPASDMLALRSFLVVRYPAR